VIGPEQTAALVLFGSCALAFAVGVFRTASMVRSALSLLGTMASVGALFLSLDAEFLGVLQLMMMASELSIMAAFRVMYMMDPGGLGAMEMTHQTRGARIGGALAAAAAAAVGTRWGVPVNGAPGPRAQNQALGLELMGRSMLIFETAGICILVAMVAATMAIRSSR
jgi:NADH:ubiquinone oxidoreductase subunit 6 (subunit J)